VTQNTAVVSVVDIRMVRLIANLVERDLRRVSDGTRARIDVDAYPGESFVGQVARIAPVLDPATRTAEIEIEIPNPDFRLKPGMYARVSLDVGSKAQALVVPRESVVMRNSARGVFIADVRDGGTMARFTSLVIGFENDRYIEVTDGVLEGDIVVTTGAAGLQHGDRIVLQGDGPAGGQRAGRGAPTSAGQEDGPSGQGSGRVPGEDPNGTRQSTDGAPVLQRQSR
jgi:RND family efflux transporter MFP subunit